MRHVFEIFPATKRWWGLEGYSPPNRAKNTIQRCEPLAAYIGGKSKLADTIIQVINNIPHTNYIEPFVGMGGVFFRRQDKAN